MREIDLKTLRLFVAVCDHGNMARAAEREHIEPSAVSKRIAQLEQDLGTPEARQSALGEYYQSLAVMKAVVERQPTQPALAADYGRVNRYTGQLLAQLGRPAESLEYHRRAVEIVNAY